MLNIDKKGVLKFSFFIILFLGLIIAWLGFGERGFIHLYRMEKERQDYQERIRKLEKSNRELLDQIHLLKTDQAYMESVARRELGLVRDNEIIYRLNRSPKEKEGGGIAKHGK